MYKKGSPYKYSSCNGCRGNCSKCTTCPYRNQCPLRLMVYSNYSYIAKPNYNNNGLNNAGK